MTAAYLFLECISSNITNQALLQSQRKNHGHQEQLSFSKLWLPPTSPGCPLKAAVGYRTTAQSRVSKWDVHILIPRACKCYVCGTGFADVIN